MAKPKSKPKLKPSACARCLADPQPKNFGTPRRCAFDKHGVFAPGDNWSCATIDALIDHQYRGESIYGHDETMQIVPRFEPPVPGDPNELSYAERDGLWSGWIVLTRYKSRGSTSNAVVVGDFPTANLLTLREAEDTLAEFERLAALKAERARKESEALFKRCHWLGRPPSSARNVERYCEDGTWVADDGLPGLAFIGKDRAGFPFAWTAGCYGECGDRCPSEAAGDRNLQRHSTGNRHRMTRVTETEATPVDGNVASKKTASKQKGQST